MTFTECINRIRFVGAALAQSYPNVLCGWLLRCKGFLTVLACLGLVRSCVRPVDRGVIAAGPDGFREPSPILLCGHSMSLTLVGVSQFPGRPGLPSYLIVLASSFVLPLCVRRLCGAQVSVGFVSCQHGPDNAGRLVGHGNGCETNRLSFQQIGNPSIHPFWVCLGGSDA